MTRRDRNAVGKRSILLALEDERGIRVLPVKSTRVFPVHIFHALSVSGVWVSAAFVKDNDTSKYSLMAFTIYCLWNWRDHIIVEIGCYAGNERTVFYVIVQVAVENDLLVCLRVERCCWFGSLQMAGPPAGFKGDITTRSPQSSLGQGMHTSHM